MTKACKLDLNDVVARASMSPEEFCGLMDELNASLDTMAALLGIARRNVAGYRKDKPIPRSVALATLQLKSMLDSRNPVSENYQRAWTTQGKDEC